MGLFKTKPNNLQRLTVALMILSALVAILMAIFLIVNGKWSGLTVVQADDRGQHAVIKINQQEIKVEIASTLKQQYRGLSGRKSICADCGMLFNFSDSGVRAFVMRDMKFPLDIIFIENGIIRNIAANLEPEGNNPMRIYESDGPANQVLEVNGGYCQKYNIRPGDRIQLEQ